MVRNIFARLRPRLPPRVKRLAGRFGPGLVLAAAIGLIVIIGLTLSGWREALRDALFAVYAHQQAQTYPPQPVTDLADYLQDRPTIPFGIASNSVWLTERVRFYVPFMAYEHIRPDPRYPRAVAFFPFTAEGSFHRLGTARCDVNVIALNERYVIDPRFSDDAAELMATLVHELIHLQAGAFCEGPPQLVESATQAATVEVLAAACNYGDDLSCRAFWLEVRDQALASLHTLLIDTPLPFRVNGEGLYQAFVNRFIRAPGAIRAAEKAYRHWAETPDGLQELHEILRRYGAYPWRAHLLPGLLANRPLNTGHVNSVMITAYLITVEPLLMPFDDAQALIGQGTLSFLRFWSWAY